jgi:hypothetical protein
MCFCVAAALLSGSMKENILPMLYIFVRSVIVTVQKFMVWMGTSLPLPLTLPALRNNSVAATYEVCVCVAAMLMLPIGCTK